MLRLLIVLTALLSAPAFALDLPQARAQGVVGELPSGYVAAVQATPGTQALVSEVNEKRRGEYLRISQQNGQPVDIVAKLAAQQIIGKLPPGAMYQDPSGAWKKK